MEQHDDDQPIGRVLTRREMMSLLGGLSAAAMAGASLTRLNLEQLTPTSTPTFVPTATGTALPSCVVRPALTEGPYFVDGQLNRSDIRVDSTDDSIKEGVLLNLTFRVSEVSSNTCKPLEGAQVDIWHCDALGVYSGVTDPGFDTSEQLWLRGYQITDEYGEAKFITIYPGWYPGRTVHIHFKIRTDPESEQGYEFTSQLFFDEAISDVVHELEPYAEKGYRNTLNEDDNIFRSSEGLLTLTLVENEDEEGEETGGYTAVFDIGLDTSEESTESGGYRTPPAPRP